MLNHDAKLYAHHLTGGNDLADFLQPVAEVNRHPRDPNVWGLKNASTGSGS